MHIAPTYERIDPRTEERLERIEAELEELNTRLDAVIEAVRLLAPQHYSPPWSENRVYDELRRASAAHSAGPAFSDGLVYDDDRR